VVNLRKDKRTFSVKEDVLICGKIFYLKSTTKLEYFGTKGFQRHFK
jgi:hypothetical protein